MTFDDYAKAYSGGMEVFPKKALGGTQDAYLLIKAKWLLMDLARNPLRCPEPEIRLLDFGCGTGNMIRILQALGFSGRIEGCDVSEAMLAEAAGRWDSPAVPPLHLCTIDQTPFPSHSFDLIIASSVFHHIAPHLREKVLAEIDRIIRPEGRFVVFEHNPRNPLTRYVVSRTPIDKDAVLLTSLEMTEAMKGLGFVGLRTHYLMFFPPILAPFRRLERFLEWLPLGGQYAVVGSKRH